MTEETSTAAPVTRRCPACGAEVAAGELFCETCGAEVAAADTSNPSAGSGSPADPVLPPAAAAPLGGAVHDGTLLDDATVAATDRWRHAAVQVRDTDLAALPPACAVCGGVVADDGYCEQCGAAAPRLRDHWRDQPAGWLAGVCDRGVRHARNEDAMAVAASLVPGGLGAMVVCDGVSMAVDSDVASLAAARAARAALIDGLEPRPREAAPASDGDVPPPRTGQQTARSGEFTARVVAAGAAAQERAAATAASVDPGKNPPSCTFVAALVERSPGTGPGLLVVGWVGDSRAYWIPDEGSAVQLSEDDSWAAEAIAQGLPRAEAENMPQSHAITRWLGADAHDPVPRTRVMALERAGWVLLCSDGLWNYCSEAEDLAALFRRTADDPDVADDDPAALAEALVAWAIAQGGHDNITVLLARFDPQATTEPQPPPPAVHPVLEPEPTGQAAAQAAAQPSPPRVPVPAGPVDPTATLVEPPAVPLPPAPAATTREPASAPAGEATAAVTSEPPGSGAEPAAPPGLDPT